MEEIIIGFQIRTEEEKRQQIKKQVTPIGMEK
jgi:hypothetical protein